MQQSFGYAVQIMVTYVTIILLFFYGGGVMAYQALSVFNAKFCLFIYSKLIWFKEMFLNEKEELIFLYTVKWFQLLQSKRNNFIFINHLFAQS